MAETFRPNPEVDVEAAVTDLAVGEALLSLLEADGSPSMVQRAFVVPPHGHIGAITAEQRQQIMANSLVAGHYEQVIDRESAEEVLKARAEAAAEAQAMPAARPSSAGGAKPPASGRTREGMFEAMSRSVVRAVGSQMGRQLARGIMGTFMKVK